MTRYFIWVFVLTGCNCEPVAPEPCRALFTEVDAGVHWFRLPVYASTGASELENLEDQGGALVPKRAGPVAFVLETECARERQIGFATDQPFVVSPALLSFPITRPAKSAALPLTTTNQTDDPIEVALGASIGYRTDSVVRLGAHATKEFFVFFEPPSLGIFDGQLVATAFSEATARVGLHGIGGGPVVNLPHFDAGLVASLGPQTRPDGRFVLLSNDATVGEASTSNLLLPPSGTSNCIDVQLLIEDAVVLPGGSTRMLLLLPASQVGSFDCSINIASAPQPISFRASWRSERLPPCDMTWPLLPVPTDAGHATIELNTFIDGCYLTYPRVEPADAGVVLARWTELVVPPQSTVPVDVFVWGPGQLRINISSPPSPTLSVSILP